MTLLNFPSDPASVNNIYVGPNGVRYIFDGVKWVGQSAGGGGISTELVNGVHNVAITPSGTIEFPYFTFPASDGANGQVLKTNGSGVLSWTSDSTTTYRLYNTNLTNPAQHYTLEVDTNGVVVLPDRSIINGSTLRGIYGTGDANFTGITIGPDAGHQEESWVWVDKDGSHIATRYSGGISAAKQWDFDNSGDLIIPNGGHIKHQDGSPYSAAATNTGNFTFIGSNIEMPDSARLNSGGIGNDGASEFGTDVSYESGDDANPIVSSEIFMGSGYGEFRSIYNKIGATESGLTYGGVEGFNYASYGDVNFAGMVSQTPNIDSMYAVGLNEQGQIVIGFTQNGQTQTSNDWSVVVGTLTTDYTVNGLFANTDVTVIGSGLSSWTFGGDGVLNLPNNNGQIGQLEPPYTGLEFRTGSGADWIGISYGEIDDNNTSYFYFDKDGEDYLTANHRAHLQIKNPAHDGHVEWLFESDGSLTLPSAGKIVNNDNTWTFSSVGDLAVPGQVKNAQGHRAVWSNEVPRDVSDLTDNQMLLGMNSSTIDINIDGGGAYATYEGTLVRADGGFSSVRWGINSVIYDGGSGAGGTYTNSLNGGGA